MDWDPAQYLRFAGPRLRPSLDLIGRIPLEAPSRIIDLGCGPGNVTPYLTARWPAAQITGVDRSADMLARARAEHPDRDWIEADLTRWAPDTPVDLIFSNAVLHWIEDHAGLFRRLAGFLAPGGVLAVQMPRNFAAPSHQGVVETVETGPWADKLRPLLLGSPVQSPQSYYRILTGLGLSPDLWETEYLHVLEGENPIPEWTKGTVLRPLLDALDSEQERADFWADYAARMRKVYPPQADGRTLFPFRRLFFVAVAPQPGST
ncbi:MAG: methyltransferase domain-containing protein [Alphaproteobacteria bacterium]|nr:methyltransferase domain-containing protein [Alphaproteobacteria bacterium]